MPKQIVHIIRGLKKIELPSIQVNKKQSKYQSLHFSEGSSSQSMGLAFNKSTQLGHWHKNRGVQGAENLTKAKVQSN